MRDIENEHKPDKGGSGMLAMKGAGMGGSDMGFYPCPRDETHLYGDLMVKWKAAQAQMST